MYKDAVTFLWDVVVRSFEVPQFFYSSEVYNDEDCKIEVIENHFGTMELGIKLFEEQKQKISRNVKLTRKDEVQAPERISFHERFGWILQTDSIKSFLGKLILGDETTINIGHRSYFSGPVNIRGEGHINIGAFCCIAENVSMYAGNDNHPQNFPALVNFQNARFVEDKLDFNIDYGSDFSLSNTTINIGHDVWIGRNCQVSGGVSIGTGSIIGQSSLVLHDCDAFSLYVGSPSKKIKERFDQTVRQSLLDSRWWDWTDDEIAKNQPFFSKALRREYD